jgi:hypothetical protein
MHAEWTSRWPVLHLVNEANMATYLLSDKKIKTSGGLNLVWYCCTPSSENIGSNAGNASFS